MFFSHGSLARHFGILPDTLCLATEKISSLDILLNFFWPDILSGENLLLRRIFEIHWTLLTLKGRLSKRSSYLQSGPIKGIHLETAGLIGENLPKKRLFYRINSYFGAILSRVQTSV